MAHGSDREGLDRRDFAALLAATAAVAACAPPRPKAPAYAGVARFAHGVAAALDGADGAILWTRVSATGPEPVPVRWILARNSTLTRVVATGVVETGAARDFTVRVPVSGLPKGQPLFYGFLAGDAESAPGRLRLPAANTETVTLALAAPGPDPAGFAAAAAGLAALTPPPDLILHAGPPPVAAPGPGVTDLLAAARAAHARLRADPAVQAALALAPWAFAPDLPPPPPGQDPAAWTAAQRQAADEWLPRAAAARLSALATLVAAAPGPDATPPLAFARDLRPLTSLWDFANPFAPFPVPDNVPPPPTARPAPTLFDLSTEPPRAILDWSIVARVDPRRPPPGLGFLPDVAGFRRGPLADPARSYLGPSAEAALAAAFADGAPAWRLVLTPDSLAPRDAPDLSEASEATLAALAPLAPHLPRMAAMTRLRPPWSLAGWDGSPAARDRLIGAARQAGAGVIGLSPEGLALEALADSGGAPAGFTLGAGAASVAARAQTQLAAQGLDWAALLRPANPGLVLLDPAAPGLWRVTLRADRAVAELFTVPAEGPPRLRAAYEVRRAGGRISAVQPSSGRE